MKKHLITLALCAAAVIWPQTGSAERIMQTLEKEYAVKADEGLRVQVREMLANGCDEKKALALTRTCLKNGAGDSLGETLRIANRAMLGGVKVEDIEKDVALAAQERDRTRTQEQTRTMAKDGSQGSALRDRVRTMLQTRLEKMDSAKAKSAAQELRTMTQERRQAQGENKKTTATAPGGRR